ncbi:MAG: SPFH domain-containing protein [Christensenellaceae bacterium]
MAIGIILGIVFFVLLAVGFSVGGYFLYRGADEEETKYKIGGWAGIALGVAFLFTFIFVPFSFHTVDTGEVAVVKHMGEAKEVRTAGTYYDFWVTEKYEKYDAKVQNIEITSMAYSKDAQTMDVAMTVQFQIDSTKVIDIAKQYGSMVTLTNRIQSVTIEKTKSTLSSYSAMDIIQNRSSISPKVENAIKEAVDEEFYVNITAVVLTNIDFSDAFEKIVEDKMIAEQEKLKAQYEKETAIVNAEKELEVAKLAAEAKIEAAKADAQAQVEIAKAEAMAIKLKSIEVARTLGFEIKETTTTDEDGNSTIEYEIDFTGKTEEEIAVITDYLKYMDYLAKWDGELPNVVTDGSANIVVPTP